MAPQIFFEFNSSYFANISFVFLFLAMTFYWVNLAFFDKQKSKLAKTVTLPNDLSNTLEVKLLVNQTDLSDFLLRSSFFSSLPKLTLVLSNISLILLLCSRWKESGHFPLSNLYESLMFLSWSCTSINIFLLVQNVKTDLLMENLLGSVLAPCALFLNAFATFSLPKEMQQAGPLVPALQSNWLMMHVTVMIVSYAALILGSLLSIAFVIYNYTFFKVVLKNSLSTTFFDAAAKQLRSSCEAAKQASKQPDLYTNKSDNTNKINVLENGNTLNPMLKATTNITFHNKILYNLDYYSYRIIGIGFPFLTIGILSGAVWANEAWGSYWSWDPKETWALLTWFVFAIYLHTRFTKGWEGVKPAMIASFGFIVVWVCYLGVNLLGEGLHSYGFLT